MQYPVMEIFYSLQGEGFHSGRPAAFIRLGGCDVGCFWCDVKESWNADQHPPLLIEEISNEILKYPCRFVVITGGEPCMYDLSPLCNSLHKLKMEIALETSGAYPVKGSFDWICVSPKKFKPPIQQNLRSADELKVVIYNKSDFNWAEQHASRVRRGCRLFLQPEYSVKEKTIPLILDYIQTHPQWSLSLQVHKIIHVR